MNLERPKNRDWEIFFTNWAAGPSQSEQQRSENAEKQIRDAIAASDKLRARNIKVFTQGSYKNCVNVKKDSDVDVGIVCYDTMFTDALNDDGKRALQASYILICLLYQFSPYLRIQTLLQTALKLI